VDAGHADFSALRPVAAQLADVPAPWYVAGGWALDLFLGRVTRRHGDLDVAILRAGQLAFQWSLAGWDLRAAVPGIRGRLEPWQPGAWLASPIHEIHARFPANQAASIVSWGRRPAGQPDENAATPPTPTTSPIAFELLLNECAGDDWLFRRQPAITYPLALLGRRSPEGIPYLAPEVALLYKVPRSTSVGGATFRPADEADFRAVAPYLDAEQRAQLRTALETSRPGHPWIAALA